MHFLHKLPKQHHLLGTMCLDTWSYESHFSLKPLKILSREEKCGRDKASFVLINLSNAFQLENSCISKIWLTQSCFLYRVRFLLGGRHGEFKFLPPPGYAACYEAVLPKEKLKVEHSREYKQERTYTRDLLGPTVSLTQAAFTPVPVDTSQVQKETLMTIKIQWLSSLDYSPQQCTFQPFK